MDGQSEVFFPVLAGPDASLEIRGDILPRLEIGPPAGHLHRRLRAVLPSLWAHEPVAARISRMDGFAVAPRGRRRPVRERLVRALKAELKDLVVECRVLDPEDLGRASLIPMRFLEDVADYPPLEVLDQRFQAMAVFYTEMADH